MATKTQKENTAARKVPGKRKASLQKAGMLGMVSVSQFSNSAKDKAISAEVTATKSASEGMLRVNKTLIDSPKLKEIRKLVGHIRNNIVNKLTIPWDRSGKVLIGVNLIQKFQDEMGEAKVQWEGLVAEFLADYNDAVNRAIGDLGDAFDPADYPSPAQVEEKFKFELHLEPIPDSKDIRLSLPEAQLDAIREEVESTQQARFADANKAVVERTIDTLRHLADRCKAMTVNAEGKTTNPFRDSTVTNLIELAEILPGLNVTNDAALKKATTAITLELRELDPDVLRKDKGKRTNVAATAEKIANTLEGAF
jgi:hypothetical protein